jgi:hypothetical protein
MTTTPTDTTTTSPSQTAHIPGGARTAAAPRTLDELAALDVAALEEVYRRGTVPASLRALDGSPVCRMLAVRGLDRGPVSSALRTFARASFFPWAGKSFQASSDDAGTGVNRVRLAGTRRWFPFHTRIEPSSIDGEPCVLLDYDDPVNPRPIRMIRDELREVSPGLFLGPALLDTGKGDPRVIVYFACDCSGN